MQNKTAVDSSDIPTNMTVGLEQTQRTPPSMVVSDSSSTTSLIHPTVSRRTSGKLPVPHLRRRDSMRIAFQHVKTLEETPRSSVHLVRDTDTGDLLVLKTVTRRDSARDCFAAGLLLDTTIVETLNKDLTWSSLSGEEAMAALGSHPEIRIRAQLRCGHGIAPVYHICTDAETVTVAMPYFSGGDLASKLLAKDDMNARGIPTDVLPSHLKQVC